MYIVQQFVAAVVDRRNVRFLFFVFKTLRQCTGTGTRTHARVVHTYALEHTEINLDKALKNDRQY